MTRAPSRKMLGIYSKHPAARCPMRRPSVQLSPRWTSRRTSANRLPYCNNGHDGVDYQYTESVVEKVRAWIEAHGRPSPITVNGKNYAVVYKKE